MISGDRAASAAATAIWERRLIRDAQRGDRAAEARLLELYEPMARYIAMTHFMPGGERDDLAQHARLGVLCAIHAWDPRRRVPFSSFAWLCAVRETRMAVRRRARRQAPAAQRRAQPASDRGGENGHALEDTLEATGRPDVDPVAKALARERLREILARARTLTELERRALALSANDISHRECAGTAGRGGEGGQQRAAARAAQTSWTSAPRGPRHAVDHGAAGL